MCQDGKSRQRENPFAHSANTLHQAMTLLPRNLRGSTLVHSAALLDAEILTKNRHFERSGKQGKTTVEYRSAKRGDMTRKRLASGSKNK